MLTNPTWIVTPSGFQKADQSTPFQGSGDPIGAATLAACDGDSFQLVAGAFPPIKASLAGRRDLKFCGWRGPGGELATSILPDVGVGSTDNVFLERDTGGIVLEALQIPLDDRAGIKTSSGVGRPNALIDCFLYGPGSPHDPLWKANTKWGVHGYDTAGWTELRVWKWSIYGEHGDYLHNIQGNHAFSGGGAAMLGGCDIFIANRMNEGAVGKGDITIEDRYTEDVCVGQGGSGLSFRGGMPTSKIHIKRWKLRLGCKATLAAPFNDNICGGLVVDSADETTPGRGDAAWPGGTGELVLDNCDLEVGTIYVGRTGMIRPVVSVASLGSFVWLGGRMKVRRAAGAYPIGLNIEDTVGRVAIGDKPEWDGWVQYHGTRYQTLDAFLSAHPECAA